MEIGIMDTIKRSVLNDDTLHILPTFLRVEEEMVSALNGSASGAIFGKKIFTFPQLIGRLYEEVTSTKGLLSPIGQLILIERIINTIYKDKNGKYFTPLINSKTFSKTLRNIINSLKSFNISHDIYGGIVGKWEGEDKKKLGELAAIYGCYQRKLTELELLDYHGMNEAVKDFVADQNNNISFLKGVRHLVVEDMYDFTPVQFDLIVAIAHRVEHTTVIIPYDHDRDDIFNYVERTIKKFESLWELNIDINLDFKPQREGSQGKLSEVIESCFRRDGRPAEWEPISIGDEITLIETTGIYQEAEAIGKEIRKLLDAGVEPSKIGVFFRDISLYSEMIEDVFHRFKIPLYFRRGKPLLLSNAIKTILSLFELLDKNFERDTFIKIIRSNYIDFWAGEDCLAGNEMEWYILKAGIIDDRGNAWENKLAQLIERIDKKISLFGKDLDNPKNREEREKAERLKGRVGYIRKALEGFRKKNTIGGFCAILRRLIEDLRIPYQIIDCEDEEILKRDSAALGRLEEIFEALNLSVRQLALENETFTYTYFHKLLLKFMEESFILSGRESVHGVKVLNLYESRGLTFDYVFLGGLIEDSFPGKMWQDPFLKDEEKAQFNHLAGKKVFLLMDEKWEEEPLLFYLGLSCAQRGVYLSYSRLDAQGRTALPSLYINELIRLVDKRDGFANGTAEGLIVPQLRDCFEQEEIENRISYTLWRSSFDDRKDWDNLKIREESLIASLFNQLITHDQFRHNFKRIFHCAEIEKIRELFFLEENLASRKSKSSIWTGLITDEGIKRELKEFFEEGEGHFWSPSQLELYVNCPFRFFLERLLKVIPLKIPEEEIEKVDEGSLIHKVLERFFKVRKEAGLLPVDGSEEEKYLIKKIADEIYRQWEKEKYIGDRILWEIRKKKLAPLWERFIEAESRYRDEEFLPTYFEFLIGSFFGNRNEGDMPPLVIKGVDQKEILVGGKVDRVDIGPDAFRVIDYKNSSSEGIYRNLLKGEKIGVVNFQIPVYLAALKEYLSEQTKIDSMEGTFYLFRKAKRMKPYIVKSSDPFFEKDPKKRMELKELGRVNLFNKISEIVEGVKKGDYSLCPQDCTFCEYTHICRLVPVDNDEGRE